MQHARSESISPIKFGLSDDYWQRIMSVLRAHSAIERAVLYGSRAKGTYRRYSDIDITLIGDSLTEQERNVIANELDDKLLPYFIDLSLYSTITSPELLSSIDSTGVTIYERS